MHNLFSVSSAVKESDITYRVYFPGCGWDQLKNGICKRVNTRQCLGFRDKIDVLVCMVVLHLQILLA